MTIRGKIKQIEAVDTEAVCEQTMKDSADTLADLNAEQINTGLKADGTEMPEYSFRSVFQYGKQPGPIRLRDTGAWQAGISVNVQAGVVVFSSTDGKDAMLTERYGDTIHGLSEKYRYEALRDAVQPNFKKQIEAATGLVMR